jgi:Flp pilus assembly protein TadG
MDSNHDGWLEFFLYLKGSEEMKFIRNKKGQSIVEFALIIPILLIFVMAIIEFGFLFNAFITISNASREGARLGSLGGSDIEISNRVDSVSARLDVLLLDVNITPASRDRGDMVTVIVDYDYQMITPVISNLLSPLVNLEAETTMRVE